MATRARRAAPRIKGNTLTEMGEWDEAALRAEIAGLLADDFDALRYDPGVLDPDRADRRRRCL